MVDLSPAQAFVAANSPTIDDMNNLSARLYALSKDCPGKAWWDADPMHPAICRALRIDPADEGAVFAKAPFRLAQIDGAHVILAAYPTPRMLGPVDGDWLGIETVIAWHPRSDAATILADPEPQLTGRLTDDTPRLYASARSFFTDWLRARAAFFVLWQQSRKGKWAHGATEHDLAPGALVVGNVDAIRWRPSTMPENLECVGLDAKKLNRALLKAARVPRAHQSSVRAAA
jgi:hypothetical protein